jgi:3-oxoadipate enol-lactonase
VVLLHPVGLDLTSFDGIVAELRSRFRILRADMRGHGASPLPPPQQSLDDYATDVHALLTSLQFAPAAVVGFSFGGMIAQTLALSYQADVSALVIGACACTFPATTRRIMVERGELAAHEGMSALLEPTMRRWFSEQFLDSGRGEPIRDRLLSDDIDGWVAAWKAISALDTADRLASIRVPTLCLAGGSDLSAPPPVVEAIAYRIQSSRLVVIPDAPHMLFIEQPHAVACAISGFLDEVLNKNAA